MSAGEYVIGVVGASVAVSLVRSLMADDSGGIKKTLSYVLSVAMVVAVMLPIGGLLSDFLEGIENGKYDIELPDEEGGDLSSVIDEAEKISAEELAAALEEKVEEHFSLPEGSIEIILTLEFGDNADITSLTVYLHGKAMWTDPREIKKFIYGITEFECEVVT
jgi:hypothetical protein